MNMYTLSSLAKFHLMTDTQNENGAPAYWWVGTGCLCVGTARKCLNGTSEPLWRQKRYQHVSGSLLFTHKHRKNNFHSPHSSAYVWCRQTGVRQDNLVSSFFSVQGEQPKSCATLLSNTPNLIQLEGRMETVKLPLSLSAFYLLLEPKSFYQHFFSSKQTPLLVHPSQGRKTRLLQCRFQSPLRPPLHHRGLCQNVTVSHSSGTEISVCFNTCCTVYKEILVKKT